MMSHQPLGSDWPEQWPSDFPYPLVHQGISAEMMAEEWHLSRETLDDFAFQSHLKAGEAIQSGRLADQIVPVTVPMEGNGKSHDIKVDQGVRIPPDRHKMRQLAPVFKEDGVITAGNSSQISDGAAALLLASDRAVQRLELSTMARIVTRVVVGSDPVLMLSGPIPATQKALDRAERLLEDIHRIEINEAFASVVLAWQLETGAALGRINPDGGAIAHGHPLGATGAVLMTKLVHGLRRSGGGLGLQTMCIGHGMATATIVEST
jgi:acetyl-CoA acetyltransferase family protein